MPYISKITLPSGTSYDIKDAYAREVIETLAGGDAVVFIGVSSTALTDGGTEKPTINNEQVNPSSGQLFFYGTSEFIWGKDSKWHELGDLSSLGSLAYKNSASATYTPAGSISKPTFTGSGTDVSVSFIEPIVPGSGNYTPTGSISLSGGQASASYKPKGGVSVSAATSSTTGYVITVNSDTTQEYSFTPSGSISTPTISLVEYGTTTQIKNPTSTTVVKTVATAAPGATAPANALTYYSVSNETLSLYQLGYTTGNSITTSNVTVKTGDATYVSSTPTFTGNGVRLITENITIPSTYSATFAGTQETVTLPITTEPTATFTGTEMVVSGYCTPLGGISTPSFTGTEATITVT